MKGMDLEHGNEGLKVSLMGQKEKELCKQFHG